MRFYKYHGLGNDYLVMNPAEIGRELTLDEIRLICHRHYGMGSDGILWGPSASDKAPFKLRIFNPDGSEAEKSGNGLRIFSRYLYDHGFVRHAPFQIETLGGIVTSRIHSNGMVDVQMGKVSFDSRAIPVLGPPRQVLNEKIAVMGRELTFCAVTIGNPHCVLPMDELSEELARTFGPHLEVDARFPNRTNVQFLKVLDRRTIQIEIWERGAGYTLASGSSASAAAAVAHRLGFCDAKITVHMPGGELVITISDDYSIDMTGPVIRIGAGIIDDEAFSK
ncbi:diaminopimelate epimerase [candidate division KSB1 bacterium]|nr:diaminopimelate epimerase [candidate division KSB1 bacterium]RQW10240.1 MAG: diaminopimelate epimerase [candidate division KSB1 bacterium]